jgi:hypothetical protein
MTDPQTKPYNFGRPVPFTRPSPLTVGLSHVLLFLMVVSPVFGVALGGWALHEIGQCMGRSVREWHHEWRERRETERRHSPMVWRAPGAADRPADRFVDERAQAEF